MFLDTILTYIPNGGEKIGSVAHGRSASSEQSKMLCSRSRNFPCLSFELGASEFTAGPFACYWQTSRRHGIVRPPGGMAYRIVRHVLVQIVIARY
jgi:hypothetical protein